MPERYDAANARILATLIAVFCTSYSRGVQDSMYRMGIAALAEVPELGAITFVMPNMHYVPIDLSAFGQGNPGVVFLPTDEPSGRMKATITRGARAVPAGRRAGLPGVRTHAGGPSRARRAVRRVDSGAWTRARGLGLMEDTPGEAPGHTHPRIPSVPKIQGCGDLSWVANSFREAAKDGSAAANTITARNAVCRRYFVSLNC